MKSNYELGQRAASELRITPQRIPYIEARGFLCHELFILLGGHFSFVKTPRKQYCLKILERFFPIAPICRWYPPESSILERLGSWPDCVGAEIYRLTSTENPTTVFFVEPEPEPHPNGWHVPIFYKCPRLMLERFLRPPFERGCDSTMYERQLRAGAVKRLWAPLVTQETLRDMTFKWQTECNRGMWELLSKRANNEGIVLSIEMKKEIYYDIVNDPLWAEDDGSDKVVLQLREKYAQKYGLPKPELASICSEGSENSW